MLGFLKGMFSSGIVGSVERIASEYIETDKESAEAKSLLVKVLDPNGKLRRDVTRFANLGYGYYLFITSILALCHAFGVGEAVQTKEAIKAMTELFLPITTAWGTIVTASFGVNATNSIKGK